VEPKTATLPSMSLTETGETSITADELKKAIGWTKLAKLPKPITVGLDASIWLARVERLRKDEAELAADGRFKALLPRHRVIVSTLIAEGETIICLANMFKISKFPDAGFTLSDLESTVESLRVTFQCLHDPQNTPAVNAGIRKMLNGS